MSLGYSIARILGVALTLHGATSGHLAVPLRRPRNRELRSLS